MNILLIGAGRMAQRHLQGLNELEGSIIVVEPRKEAEKELRKIVDQFGVKAEISFYTSFECIPENFKFDGAILSATANGRLERLKQVIDIGVKNVLIEKPLEQSRKRVLELNKLAQQNALNIKCNHYHRTLPFYTDLRNQGGPFHITITGGAYGLACNGVHWLDLSSYLTGNRHAKLLFGEIDSNLINSGRGKNFKDLGGRGFYLFDDNSRLYLNCIADSSAPMSLIITKIPNKQYIIDRKEDIVTVYERDEKSKRLPNYLYGVDYCRSEIKGIETIPLWENTRSWLRSIIGNGTCHLPNLADALIGHELLFDLLEITGKTEFPIT